MQHSNHLTLLVIYIHLYSFLSCPVISNHFHACELCIVFTPAKSTVAGLPAGHGDGLSRSIQGRCQTHGERIELIEWSSGDKLFSFQCLFTYCYTPCNPPNLSKHLKSLQIRLNLIYTYNYTYIYRYVSCSLQLRSPTCSLWNSQRRNPSSRWPEWSEQNPQGFVCKKLVKSVSFKTEQ